MRSAIEHVDVFSNTKLLYIGRIAWVKQNRQMQIHSIVEFSLNCIVGGNSDSRLSLCFVAIRRSLLQEETDVAYAIIGELNVSAVKYKFS